MDSATLRRRTASILDRIEAARARAGRTDEVTLVAVTKTHPVEVLRAARDAEIRDLGENRVQELEVKVKELGREGLRWHLIGHLQRNKVRRAIPHFDLLHSLDSVRLARQLSDDATALGVEVQALVQVNTSGEPSKYGFDADAAVDAIGEMSDLPGLRLVGTMTMAPLVDDERVLRRTFAAARRLHEEAGRQVAGFTARHLSMGMSNDYEWAVEEGSTMVRLGTVLFGERDT
jgi:PLP dependent protein